MIIITCVDNRGGMAFNGRRQTFDRFVLASILKDAAPGKLIMSPYSADQFPDKDREHILVMRNPMETAGESQSCFIERCGPASYTDKIERIILYQWDCIYPADVFFDLQLDDGKWKLISETVFDGYSHPAVKKLVYQKK